MRSSLLAFGFFVLSASAAAAADLSGTWAISGAVTPNCTFVQAGNALSGACKGANAEGPLIGTIDGQSVKWTYRWVAYAGGNPGSFDFAGTVKGDTITGTGLINGESQPFTAARQPGAAPVRLAQTPAQSAPAPQPAPPQSGVQPAQTATPPGPTTSPPKTVWDIDVDGSALHRQSGWVCPAVSGDFRRNQLVMYDQAGFDVSCNYLAPGVGDITLYLTARDPALLRQVFEGAKTALQQRTPDAKPDSHPIPQAAGNNWLTAGYVERGGAAYSDLLLSDLSRWEFEIRVTYSPAQAAVVQTAISALSQKLVDTAGPHLAACAAAPPPARSGKAVGADNLLPMVLLGAAEAPAALENDKDAIWCAEAGLSSSTDTALYWRNIAPGAVTDRITDIGARLKPLYVIDTPLDPGKSPGQDAKALAGYDVVFDEGDSLSLVGVFDGRPSLQLLASLLGAHGVYADIGKTNHKVTLYNNAIKPAPPSSTSRPNP